MNPNTPGWADAVADKRDEVRVLREAHSAAVNEKLVAERKEELARLRWALASEELKHLGRGIE